MNLENMSVRLVNNSGRHALRYVRYDEDGEVERVMDIVDLASFSLHTLTALIEHAHAACSAPVIVVNSGNRKMLMGKD